MAYDTDENGTRWGVKPANLVPTAPLSSWANAHRIQADHDADMASIIGRSYRGSDPRLEVR